MRTTIFALTFLAAVQTASAAPQTYSLSVAPNGGLAGTGAEIIRKELPNAQFILYGEDHGFADSPIVLRAIAHEARPFGFRVSCCRSRSAFHAHDPRDTGARRTGRLAQAGA